MSFFGEEENKDISLDEVEVIDENDIEVNNKISEELVPINENKIKMDVVSTIKEIDTLYKKGVYKYTESIHRYNIEIEKLKCEIELENKKNMEEERTFFAVESILEHESKIFETLHHRFTQKLESIVELKEEYKESLDANIYNEKLSRKEREFFSLLAEIEEKEMSLLTQELEKVNLSNTLAKKLKKVEDLTRSLKELELEKGYFEATELQKLSYFSPEQPSLLAESSQIVDTVIMENI